MSIIADPSIDYCKVPLQAPPPGITPNYTNPPSRAHQIYETAAVCIPLILIFGGMRLHTKYVVRKTRSWDDVSFAVALTCGIFYIAGTVAAIANKPYGRHQWDIVLCQFTTTEIILTLVINSIYGVCAWFVKVSVFILYFVVFGVLRWMRIAVYLGIAVSGIVYVAYMISFLTLCAPSPGKTSQIEYLMALDSPGCIVMDWVGVGLGVFNVVTDFYMLVLPIFAIWQLNMSRGKKLGVSSVFLTGITACIASCLGLYYRIEVNQLGDRTWNAISPWLTGFVEITAGLMVCCMPTLAPVFANWSQPIVSFLSRSRYGRAILTTTGLKEQEERRLGSRDDSHRLGARSEDSYPLRKKSKDLFMHPDVVGRSGESFT